MLIRSCWLVALLSLLSTSFLISVQFYQLLREGFWFPTIIIDLDLSGFFFFFSSIKFCFIYFSSLFGKCSFKVTVSSQWTDLFYCDIMFISLSLSLISFFALTSMLSGVTIGISVFTKNTHKIDHLKHF